MQNDFNHLSAEPNIPTLKAVKKILKYRIANSRRSSFPFRELHDIAGPFTLYALAYMISNDIASYKDGIVIFIPAFEMDSFFAQVKYTYKKQAKWERWRKWEIHLGLAGFILSLINMIFSFRNVSIWSEVISFFTR